MAVTVGNWRFYTNEDSDASLVPLAAENTVPTLTGPQTMGGNIRLRVQLVGDASGGSVTLHGAHSVDNTNWRQWESATALGERGWVIWSNGAATSGATLGQALLTGTTTLGTYVENGGSSISVAANQVKEYDLSFIVRWWPPSTTVRHQIRSGSTALAYSAGIPQIQATSCSALERAHTIDLANFSGGQPREVDFSCWHRMGHDGNYWWWVSLNPNISTSQLHLWRWDGTGGEYGNWVRVDYSPGIGTIGGRGEGDTRHAPSWRKVNGTHVLTVAFRPTSGNLRLARATFNNGTPNWNLVDLGRAAYNTGTYGFHAGIDGGGYHWVGGFDGTSGVWAARSSNSDDGSSGFTPSFGTLDTARRTLADPVSAGAEYDNATGSGNPLSVVGLGSDSALLIWISGRYIRSARVTSSGFDSAIAIGTLPTKNPHDWCAARSIDGSKVYLVYRNEQQIGGESGDGGGTWEFWVYDVATDAWSKPGNQPQHNRQNNNNDGLIVSVSADKVYAISTGVGTGGNQDRPVQVNTYDTATGTWEPFVFVSPQQRGNGDDIAGSAYAGDDGKVLTGYLWGDNDVNGHPFTFEYYSVQGVASENPDPEPQTGPGWIRWDGSSEIIQSVGRWNGSTLIVQSLVDPGQVVEKIGGDTLSAPLVETSNMIIDPGVSTTPTVQPALGYNGTAVASTTVTGALPSVQNNDIVLAAFITNGSSTTVTALPDGWTRVGADWGPSDFTGVLCYKQVSQSEPTPSWTLSAADTWHLVYVPVRGGSVPPEAEFVPTNSSGATQFTTYTNDLSTTGNNRLHVAVFAADVSSVRTLTTNATDAYAARFGTLNLTVGYREVPVAGNSSIMVTISGTAQELGTAGVAIAPAS